MRCLACQKTHEEPSEDRDKPCKGQIFSGNPYLFGKLGYGREFPHHRGCNSLTIVGLAIQLREGEGHILLSAGRDIDDNNRFSSNVVFSWILRP